MSSTVPSWNILKPGQSSVTHCPLLAVSNNQLVSSGGGGRIGPGGGAGGAVAGAGAGGSGGHSGVAVEASASKSLLQ